MTDENASSSSSTGGDVALLAILLSLCTGAAFVFGGLLVSCSSAARQPESRRSDNLASLVFVLAFSASSFVFIGGGIADLLPLAQSGFEQFVLSQNDDDAASQMATRGVSHLLATTSFAAGVVTLYGVNMVVHKLTEAVSTCYEDHSTQRNRDPPSSNSFHHVGLGIVTSGDSNILNGAEVQFGLSNSGTTDFEVLQTSERSCNAQLIRSAKRTLIQDATAANFDRKPHHVRARIISIVTIVLHHVPAGAIIYISAMSRFQLGEVLAFAVVLHSIPGKITLTLMVPLCLFAALVDGQAFTSSIYFASGSQLRGFLWSLLAPLGKLLGSLLAWILLLRVDMSAFSRCFLIGMAAGALVAIGVTQILPAASACASDRSYGLVIGVVLGVVLLAIPKVFV